jgi:hypothetical protein
MLSRQTRQRLPARAVLLIEHMLDDIVPTQDLPPWACQQLLRRAVALIEAAVPPSENSFIAELSLRDALERSSDFAGESPAPIGPELELLLLALAEGLRAPPWRRRSRHKGRDARKTRGMQAGGA